MSLQRAFPQKWIMRRASVVLLILAMVRIRFPVWRGRERWDYRHRWRDAEGKRWWKTTGWVRERDSTWKWKLFRKLGEEDLEDCISLYRLWNIMKVLKKKKIHRSTVIKAKGLTKMCYTALSCKSRVPQAVQHRGPGDGTAVYYGTFRHSMEPKGLSDW